MVWFPVDDVYEKDNDKVNLADISLWLKGY